ncbi:ATP-binding protein [Azospirillum argentinense]|uniref:ATP-binding protein n=1 Tax=Azospirillum argentinense TaxID=2970906 RepID=UPI001FFF2AFA|nr:ATP-binding protein [Azospirillum argentinense]
MSNPGLEVGRKSRLLVARRWLPDSIASRLVLTVVLALLLTQAVSALVYLTDRPPGPPAHSMRVLVQRVTAIVQLVESTPPPERRRLVKAIDDPVLRVDWNPETPRFANQREGFPFDRLRRAIRGELDDPDRAVVVEVRRERPMPGPFPVEEHRWGTDVRLSVGLKDGSWLTFVGGDPLEGPFRLLRFALWMAGIVGAVALVSVWTARRMTAPIARFADAAERLGVDGEAPPLPEAGPQELRAATRAFNRMQARLARFVADRTQMVAAMSHDLRTPLTRLRLRAELVEDPEMQRKMLADLDEMAAMINATLAFARDDAKHEPRGPLDLADLLQSLCDDRVDAGHAAAYEGPAHATVDGRPVALRRAFANLMDNAIAYGGGFTVRLRPADGELRVEIEDGGPGIPEAEFEKVFAPFYRLERSRSRDTGGVGLGLATARTVVRGHGGDIALSNRPEGGLRVTVTLPR